MLIVKRLEGVSPLKYISNPSIRMFFPLDQDIFQIDNDGAWPYLQPYFEIIDRPGFGRLNQNTPAPCWSKQS